MTFFVVAVSSNVGKAPKDSGPTLFLEDAYGEWALFPDPVILDAGFDSQMSYRAYDADLFLDLPMPEKSGLTAQRPFPPS